MKWFFASALLVSTAMAFAACSGAASDGNGSGGSGNSPDAADSDGSDQDGSGQDDLGLGGFGGSPSATGWKQAFAKDAVGVTCDRSFDEMVASGAPSLTFGDATVFVGFQQYDQNQDPVFFRFDSGQKTYCEHHEKEPPDGRAYGLTWDGGDIAYVVYTIVGGGTAFDALSQGGWVKSYGDGGGSAKVTVLAQVETTFGTVQKSTFVPAKVIKNGQPKTNTLAPAAAPTVRDDGLIELFGNSAWAPLNPDGSLTCGEGDTYPGALDGAEGPNFLGRFSPDLSSMNCSSTADCSYVQTPCD